MMDAFFMGRMMFLVGIFFLIALSVGLIVFAYRILPKNKKARTCPVEEFTRAQRIVIPLPRGEEITIRPDVPAFGALIANFTDATGDPSYNTFSEKLYIKIENRQFAVEVSIEGWNFEGEEKNRRRLRDPVQTIEIIDSLKEKYFKAEDA